MPNISWLAILKKSYYSYDPLVPPWRLHMMQIWVQVLAAHSSLHCVGLLHILIDATTVVEPIQLILTATHLSSPLQTSGT